MKQVNGDLIALAEQGEFDVIVHGCNCFHRMGAGIAGQFARKYPQVPAADINHTKYGDWYKLGDYSSVVCEDFIVVNAYTQFGLDPSTRPVEYTAIRDVFVALKEDYGDKRIAYPKIGCGLAGGDWNIVKLIIDDALEGVDHTLVNYVP